MLYSDIVPLIYVNETICMVICPSSRFKLIILWPKMNHLVPRLSQNTSYGWEAWCLLSFKTFLSFINKLRWLYNIQLKTNRGVFFLPPSDVYVRSFLYLLYTLTKLLLHESSEWSSLLSGPRLNSSSPGSKNPGIVIQQQPFSRL